MQKHPMKLEVCLDSVESALAAERGGADRIELCANLIEGGTTPSAGLIATIRRHVAMDLFVMIRPRGGDFLYTDTEFEVMQDEIGRVRSLGADGVVLGLLNADGQIDVARTQQLVELADPLPVTFHRAIDMTADIDQALQEVIRTGCTRILTSGGRLKAPDGRDAIARLVAQARGRIAIMAGSGVSPENIAELAAFTGVNELHSSARVLVQSPMRFRKEGLSMGEFAEREYQRYVVCEEKVRALRAALAPVAK